MWKTKAIETAYQFRYRNGHGTMAFVTLHLQQPFAWIPTSAQRELRILKHPPQPILNPEEYNKRRNHIKYLLSSTVINIPEKPF